jgi:DMSO reductase anchor subunit
VFTGTVASTLAILFFLRGAGQALAGADLDTLVTTIAALIVSAMAAGLIGPLLLGRQAQRMSRPMILALCALLAITVVQFIADLTGSVTGALSGAAQNPAAAYQALEQSPRGWLLLGVYQMVVYLWGLAVLILPLGGPTVQPRPPTPAVEADVTVGDLILRWK